MGSRPCSHMRGHPPGGKPDRRAGHLCASLRSPAWRDRRPRLRSLPRLRLRPTGGLMDSERLETEIIGGGRAGLATGYHLAKRDLPFVILDANERIGDAWRKRWDSLRLFTPARYSGLPDWPFPAPAWSFPTKDEVADYLEAYAARFDLPVRTGVRVDGLSREADRYVVAAGDRRFEADQVVVATGANQVP